MAVSRHFILVLVIYANITFLTVGESVIKFGESSIGDTCS